MKSIFTKIILGFICFFLSFCGCPDANNQAGSTKNDTVAKVHSAHVHVNSSKVCCNSQEDSLLICDEFMSIFESKKYLCIISYSNECKIAKSYIKTIQNLEKRFGDTVQFCLLDPGVGSMPITGLDDLLFHDNLGVICGRFGMKVYPQAVVYSCLTRSKIYSGKIDDRAVSLGVISKVSTKNYLFDVLSNVVLGKPNTVASNEAVGCFIGPFESVNK